MKKTDFSRHTIADLRDWNEAGRLEIQPDFQRKYVWNPPAKIMLIDSILEDIPLPKIYIASKIRHGNTHRIVIDGQQRITSILHFVKNEFALVTPYNGKHKNKKFKELPENIQNKILSYRLDFNEFENYSDSEMREIYNRVNKYTTALNKQELRRADFPGNFLNLVEELSIIDFFEDARIFTPANRRRMGDIEYTSELLVVVIAGIQDKKNSLDDYYLKYSKWEEENKQSCKQNFESVLLDISTIFPEHTYPIKSTRFKQKSDFYSLFAGILSLINSGFQLQPERLKYLIEDLKIIDRNVLPGEHNIFGQYASKCLADANSKSSREWRKSFMIDFLAGAYSNDEVCEKRHNRLIATLIELEYEDAMCPLNTYLCPICNEEEEFDDEYWTFEFPTKAVFLSTSKAIHKKCLTLEPTISGGSSEK
jgi:uncharacterized protein with ParB-like and HNH nuclease domain